ncbi:MAG TPA: toprim domain-containing protein [Thermoplasmata archaeon]|nr:toprim domain-containing protein [Thermoplasmata archaeon]
MARSDDSAAAFDEFVDLWDQFLDERRDPTAIVVVEGERDRRALRRLGWDGPVGLVHRGRPIAETAQELIDEHARVIVLTDWDREGGTLARRLREFLEGRRGGVDLEYRRRFARLLRGELAHVEGLYGWVRRNAERHRVPFEAIVGDASGAPTG